MNPVPQVPAMATSGASGQNVEAGQSDVTAPCDERPAGGSNPAAAGLLADHIEAYLAPTACYYHWKPTMQEMRIIVLALRAEIYIPPSTTPRSE